MFSTEPELLDALAELLLSASATVPRERLSTQLKCSSQHLETALHELRTLGAPIVETAAGCVLTLADPLDAATIREALPPTCRIAVNVRRVCASTNDELRTGEMPAMCVAEAQTAGRGRRGQDWVQSFGQGLALSFAAAAPRGRLDPLAVALAASVAAALRDLGYAGIGLKWPNDLWADGRKLGGVLVVAEGGAAPRVIVGLGLNVHAAPKLAGRETAALVELGPPPLRNLLAGEMVAAIADGLARYQDEGFAPFAREFAAFDVLVGHEIALEESDRKLRGVACGIDAAGALILDTANGRLSRTAGEVRLTCAGV
ncbi:MAG: biotin--[acetyl-CoA-carboxylase] ligase [Gammaproteobacteria bacterium]